MSDDIRVTVTKKILKESLLTLMQTIPFEKITIKDICSLSNVSRSTFYSHYTDIFALIADYEKDLYEAYNLELIITDFEKTHPVFIDSLTGILQKIDKNHSFYKIYLENMREGYMTNAIDNFSHALIDQWMESSIFPTRKEAEYLFLFYKTGIISIVKEWLNEPETERKSPRELSDSLLTILSIAPKYLYEAKQGN